MFCEGKTNDADALEQFSSTFESKTYTPANIPYEYIPRAEVARVEWENDRMLLAEAANDEEANAIINAFIAKHPDTAPAILKSAGVEIGAVEE